MNCPSCGQPLPTRVQHLLGHRAAVQTQIATLRGISNYANNHNPVEIQTYIAELLAGLPWPNKENK